MKRLASGKLSMTPSRALGCHELCDLFGVIGGLVGRKDETGSPDSVEATLSLIDGKWKGVILYRLLGDPVRFNSLRRLIPGVTQRMLTNQLRELEADGLVIRTVYPGVPPKVEYSLSPLGATMQPILEALKAWGNEHRAMFASAAAAAELEQQ